MTMTAKQRRRAEKKQRTLVARAARPTHVRPDWEHTGLILVRCVECGLEQSNRWDVRVGCVLCGCRYGTFVSYLDPSPRDVPRIESAHGPLIVERWW